MTVPYVLVAAVLGPEFPSLLGGLIGLVIVMFASSRGFLMPTDIWDFPPRERWSPAWMGTLQPGVEIITQRKMSIWLAWTPYVVVVALLFALPLVRVFINSGPDFNGSDMASMPLTLAEGRPPSPAAPGRRSRPGSARRARSWPAATR